MVVCVMTMRSYVVVPLVALQQIISMQSITMERGHIPSYIRAGVVHPAKPITTRALTVTVLPAGTVPASQGVFPATTDVILLPAAVNHRASMMAELNSSACVAFATAAVAEYYASKAYGIRYRLSPQFIYDLRNSSTPGMAVQDAGNLLSRYGSCPDVDDPFDSKNPDGKPTTYTQQMYDRAIPFKAGAFYLLTGGRPMQIINQAKSCLCDVGPVIMTTALWSPCTPGQFWKPAANGKKIGSHAFFVDGYDKIGFAVRNSWGSSWNGNGCTVLPFADVEAAVETVLVFIPETEKLPLTMIPSNNGSCGNTELGAGQACSGNLLCCAGLCGLGDVVCDVWP